MFRKVLIANRGEIAARIAAVLRGRGITSVAVYSEADADAPHRRAADESVCIGPAPVRDSYLDQNAVLDAARRTGAEAIHPGYGLLSENAGFARRCAEAGVVFVGPRPETIDAMGDKAAARRAAVEADVPVVPGSEGPVDDDEAAEIAESLGYPILVKAAGGGGGIGMTAVKKAGKLVRALQSCRDRGESSFGNPAICLEKLIESPRHIEVQILFDQHGHGVHLFERECTIQRRHQKVVEEAPSPFVTAHPELRASITDAAVRLARSIGYLNAGTIEFIVDPSGSFYFIEANTRLQVEHPVTECITGVDIIGWQLDIAAGEPLTLTQGELAIRGHAIECRVYAEDPARKFMPCPGHIDAFTPPVGEGIRLDAGVGPNQDVTPYYDPLIAKLIAHGADRATATARMAGAIASFEIGGLTTNLGLLGTVVGHEDFAAGSFDTGWLESIAKGR